MDAPAIRPFRLSTAIDFSDECLDITWTPAMLERHIDGIASIGTRRVYWGYDQPGQWETLIRHRSSPHSLRTTENFGGYPSLMRMAGDLVRDRGMEFFAFIRPFETGHSSTIPTRRRGTELSAIGGFVATCDPWVEQHPELRPRAWMGDLPPDLPMRSVGRIQLRAADDSPIRIQAADVQVWTSDDNTSYQPLPGLRHVREGVGAAERDVRDMLGNLVTSAGARVRTVDILDLAISAPYIAVTTSFTDTAGSFRNTAVEMIRAFDLADRPLPIVVASHKSVWDRPRSFPDGNLEYDAGLGDYLVRLDTDRGAMHCTDCRLRGWTDCLFMPIRPEEPECRDGVIAFAIGRNEYAPGIPSESYPEVHQEWMRWVDACLAAGAQGIDVRISNHSGWVNQPEMYGYNEPVIQAFIERYDREPVHPTDAEPIGDIRGEFYTGFLRSLKDRLHSVGFPLHHHLEVEAWRPDAPLARRRTQAGNLVFDWPTWLATGVIAEATLMGVAKTPSEIISDPIARDMVRVAHEHGVPVNLRHHMFATADGVVHADRMQAAATSGLVDGYIYYDSACLVDRYRQDEADSFGYLPGMLEALRERAQRLGLL